MVQTIISPRYDRNFVANAGKCVTIAPGIARICAPNANAYTFTGTNTYLVGEQKVAIIDPGPDIDLHFDAITNAIGQRELVAILLSHTHKDHSAMASRLSQRSGAPVMFGGQHRLSRPRRMFEVNLLHKACDWDLIPDRVLRDGDKIGVGDITLNVVTSAGHCANHICFAIEGAPFLFSGDHVMGWNSTLVASPDGSIADYFKSLDKLIEGQWSHYLPGHGGEIPNLGEKDNAREFTKQLKKHRQSRNSQIIELVNGGVNNPRHIVAEIYPDASGKTRIAAMMTILAHVEYLEQKGQIAVKRGMFRTKIEPLIPKT